MKGITGVLVGAVIVIAVILGVIWWQERQEPDNAGGLFIGITDDTADISNVNDISMEIEKVEVYSETEGWVTVSSDSEEYDLLTLKASGETKLYAQEQVAAGIYDRIRVTLGDVVVRTKTEGNVEATLPSTQVVITTKVNVVEDADTHVTLDFIADASLHSAQEGTYVFAPVVETESRSNTEVAVSSDDTVTFTGGSVDSRSSVGVDLSGASKMNFRLSTDATLRIEANEPSDIRFSLGGQTIVGGSVQREGESNNATSSGVNANVDGSAGTNEGSATGSINIDGSLQVN